MLFIFAYLFPPSLLRRNFHFSTVDDMKAAATLKMRCGDMIKWPRLALYSACSPVYLGRLSIFLKTSHHVDYFWLSTADDLLEIGNKLFSALSCWPGPPPKARKFTQPEWERGEKLIKNSSRRIRGGAAHKRAGKVERQWPTGKKIQQKKKKSGSCQLSYAVRDDRCRADMNKWINRLWSYRLITCEHTTTYDLRAAQWWRWRREAFNLSVLVY